MGSGGRRISCGKRKFDGIPSEGSIVNRSAKDDNGEMLVDRRSEVDSEEGKRHDENCLKKIGTSLISFEELCKEIQKQIGVISHIR